MPYKRKYLKAKKSWKKSSRWSRKFGKFSKKTWKRRKFSKKPMKNTSITIPRMSRFYDTMKIKLQYTYRNASFVTSLQGPTGNQYQMAYAYIRADNPNDPGGSLSTRNAQFWNTLKENYNQFSCLYSTCRVKWADTSASAQSGWMYLMPIRNFDITSFLPTASVPPVPIDTVKQSNYAQVKSYVAGYGQNSIKTFKARMSTPKLYGSPYDPTYDDQGVASITTNTRTWYWLFVWVSETAGSFSATLEMDVTFYVTLKDLINPTTYQN